jgi:S1-C subfamily serine protease
MNVVMSNLVKIINIISLVLFAQVSFSAPVDDTARLNRITPTVRAVAKVMPAVVNLSTEKIIESYPRKNLSRDYDDFFDFAPEKLFLGKKHGYSLGSGSIIDSSGLILTNAHVVQRAIRIRVTLNDGSNYWAKVIATDDLNDIALLKITGLKKELSCIKFAEPGDLILGETVIVVGNPFGLGSSISRGVLSAIGRKVTFQGQILFSDILQTDAAVFPGSSGGPLININGRMIGVNAAILREAQGIGFAIPLQRVENILARWLIPERFRDITLGLVPGVKRMKNGKLLFFLQDVIKDSPAWEAGLRPGSVITEFNDAPVKNLMDICLMLWKMKSGQEVSLKDHHSRNYTLTAERILPTNANRLAEIKLGIGVQPLTTELASALGYPFKGGLIISDLSNQDLKDIERGDMLIQLGDISIHNLNDLSRALRNTHFGQKIPAVLLSLHQYMGRFYLQKKLSTLTVR